MKRYVKAMVLDSRGYKRFLKHGEIVTLDLKSIYSECTVSGHELVSVVGSNWGQNFIRRFAIDPVLA